MAWSLNEVNQAVIARSLNEVNKAIIVWPLNEVNKAIIAWSLDEVNQAIIVWSLNEVISGNCLVEVVPLVKEMDLGASPGSRLCVILTLKYRGSKRGVV